MFNGFIFFVSFEVMIGESNVVIEDIVVVILFRIFVNFLKKKDWICFLDNKIWENNIILWLGDSFYLFFSFLNFFNMLLYWLFMIYLVLFYLL